METSTPLHPAIWAWYDWFDSEEGVRCSDITTLRAPHGDPRHLEDRLRFALVAGYKAARAAEGAAPELLAIARRLVALPSGAWHPERHAAEEAELIQEARAAIARATAPTPTPESED
jgi:hypothetical protein